MNIKINLRKFKWVIPLIPIILISWMSITLKVSAKVKVVDSSPPTEVYVPYDELPEHMKRQRIRDEFKELRKIMKGLTHE